VWKDADMWSIGVIVFLLVHGYPPFNDEKEEEIFNKIRNIFADPNARLYSWYVPPGYKVVFYHTDPTSDTLDNVTASKGYYISGPNELIVDACVEKLNLANGETFFDYLDGGGGTRPRPDRPSCLLAWCGACDSAIPSPVPEQVGCQSSQEKKHCPAVEHMPPTSSSFGSATSLTCGSACVQRTNRSFLEQILRTR
jgi:serine/threonine protein kinase